MIMNIDLGSPDKVDTLIRLISFNTLVVLLFSPVIFYYYETFYTHAILLHYAGIDCAAS